jgi:predicted GNAT family N-acyltransferase
LSFNDIIFKSVTDPSELAGAFNVRRMVFIEEQQIAEEEEYDGLDGECLQFVAQKNGHVLGTARVRFLSPGCAKIERMAVLKEYRKNGIGAGILALVEDELKRRAVADTILHAQMIAVPFYITCGFTAIGPTFYEAGIEHIKMQKRISS